MKEFLNILYNSLYLKPKEERDRILFELFGWEGLKYYEFIREARLEEE